MSLIYVRAKEGRVARVSPRGDFIPHDKWKGVRPSPYISRLLNHHGDIEQYVPEKSKPAKAEKKTDEA